MRDFYEPCFLSDAPSLLEMTELLTPLCEGNGQLILGFILTIAHLLESQLAINEYAHV